ncbi:MAG: exo-alpha-sialidase [Bryobacterales bacterium]|nr:exo-alpha-sialidase [Bryobacterales bacterium]
MPANLTRREAILLAAAPLLDAAPAVREVPPSRRFNIRVEEGWYMHSVGLAAFPDGELLCTYRRSDEHIASESEIWCCRSKDGGRTWTGHTLISRTAWDPDQACWVAPQLGQGRDGALYLLTDRGRKKSKFDWPMLSAWQLPDRGMSNHLFISRDRGRTWQGPTQTDNVGGEPGYIVELANGDLVYTRTDSKPTSAIKVPTLPWGPNYYRSTAVFSSDKGKTWNRTSVLADDPLAGDCEVGLCEYSPGKLIAITRIGDGGGRYGQPSRFFFSNDSGRTWSKPVLSPIYAQRAIVKQLRNGKLGVSFRNNSGTTGTCFFTFDPAEKFTFQPNSTIWDDTRCKLTRQALAVNTAEGRQSAVEFTFFPVEDDDSAVEFQATLQIHHAARNGCNIAAGAWIRFLPHRVELADRPQDGFAIDATARHTYRIVNRNQRLRIEVDGALKLETSNTGVFTRHVRLGNRSGGRPTSSDRKDTRQPLRGTQYVDNAAHFLCHALHVKVENRRDFSIDWRWTPSQGFPDQFYRDRVTRLEKNGSFAAGDSGYSSWAQHPDGAIVVADYTCGNPPASHPFLRAYRL